MKIPAARLDKAFAAIERAAAENRRCPDNGTHDVSSGVIGALAREGRIHVAIYAGNIRVATVLVGPHAWRSTYKPSGARRAFKTIDKNGVHIARKNRVRRRLSKAPVTLPRLKFLETTEP